MVETNCGHFLLLLLLLLRRVDQMQMHVMCADTLVLVSTSSAGTTFRRRPISLLPIQCTSSSFLQEFSSDTFSISSCLYCQFRFWPEYYQHTPHNDPLSWICRASLFSGPRWRNKILDTSSPPTRSTNLAASLGLV